MTKKSRASISSFICSYFGSFHRARASVAFAGAPSKSTQPDRRSHGLALTAARALAVATLGQNVHAATLSPLACPLDDSLRWVLCVSVLVGLMLLAVVLWLEAMDHRAGAARLARTLEQHGAGMPELAESGPRAIVRLARAINNVRRRQAERDVAHLDVQAAYAHDLRTPLTRMGLRCEMLEDASLREAMERDLAQMRELVEASVASARLQRSVAEPLQRVDADGLLGSLMRDYREAGRAIAVDGRIGQPVMACPLALRRVLANLIDNALRYGSDVRVSARVDATSLVLAVVDSGPGIRPAQMEAVFAPWVRAQQGDAEGKVGSGLGLAIARRLARSMQGELQLQNRRSGGLEARLTLPLVVA
ncbi:ATP-binding protein [Variovorax atrisoli]|uniref:ATP-binding protein n=1 Tax=Variovorax atrisoli TaxID=3394203 RepID=UPI001619601C|nr:ATP-binding protein [Variovorax sp. BK613]MBB3639494.1 signal transduction histidine kinase [Variovorax sp. BK613]